MKRTVFFFLLLLASLGSQTNAQAVTRVRDTVGDDPSRYTEELGYFRKAHSDLGDPRFMFTDQSGNFTFGLGGTFSTIGYFDFLGAVDGADFLPSNIAIPTDYSNQYGLTARGSNLSVKAKGFIGKNKLLGFMRLKPYMHGTNLSVKMDQVYLSFNGITVGQTYSFFMDLEAGPMTIDLQGPNSQVCKTHPLIGYTRYFGDRLMVGAALEESFLAFSSDKFGQYGIKNTYRSIPDVAARVKYKGGEGHVQLAAIFTDNAYWCDSTFAVAASGINRHALGYGFSLSGNYNPFRHVGFSGQFACGKGIANYIQDFDGLDLELTADRQRIDGYVKLRSRWALGGFLSTNINWSERLLSNLIYGISYVPPAAGKIEMNDQRLRLTTYGVVNLFWRIDPYARVGVEYVFGYKQVEAERIGDPTTGFANRLNASFIYQF